MGKRTTRAEECHPYATHRRFDRRGPEDDRRGGCWRAHSLSQFWLHGWRCELPGGRSACNHRRAARPRPHLSRSHQPARCTPSSQRGALTLQRGEAIFGLQGRRCLPHGGHCRCRPARRKPTTGNDQQDEREYPDTPSSLNYSRLHVISDVTIDGPKQQTSKSKLYRRTLNSTSDSHSTGTVSHIYSL